MVAWLNSLPDTQALATVGVGAPVAALALAFLVYESACFVRLAITGRL